VSIRRSLAISVRRDASQSRREAVDRDAEPLEAGHDRGGEPRRRGSRAPSTAGLVRSPLALAFLLEAAGAVALERCGAILDDRIAATEAEPVS
jgi:hypothetical protein